MQEEKMVPVIKGFKAAPKQSRSIFLSYVGVQGGLQHVHSLGSDLGSLPLDPWGLSKRPAHRLWASPLSHLEHHPFQCQFF